MEVTAGMALSREIVVNLELTSRCNRRCIVCPQGDPDFAMVRKDMTIEDLETFLQRIEEGAEAGLFVREIINAGYGESFIAKTFDAAFGRLAEFKAAFEGKWGRRPDVSVVTNGSAITAEKLAIATRAVDILKFSFPTSHPAHYGQIMLRSADEGPRLLNTAVGGLRRAMEACRDGVLPELRVHISPPVRQAREAFPETVQFLTNLAASVGLDHLRLVTFPSTSNRGGTVKEEDFLNDFYGKYRRRLHGQVVNGVRIAMLSELKVFFPRIRDVIAVLRDPFPCIWKAGSLAIDSSGNYRLCINDAASEVTVGSIHTTGLSEAYRRVRAARPRPHCAACNQNPAHMGGTAVQALYAWAAQGRMLPRTLYQRVVRGRARSSPQLSSR